MGNASSVDGFAITLSTLVIAFVVWLVLFGVLGAIAAAVAPEGRRGLFFVLTFFILGPAGVGFAAVASPRPTPVPDGVRAEYCVQCVARNLVEDEDSEFTCWQCEEEHDVQPRVAA